MPLPLRTLPLVAFNYGTPTDGLLFDKNDPMTTFAFWHSPDRFVMRVSRGKQHSMGQLTQFSIAHYKAAHRPARCSPPPADRSFPTCAKCAAGPSSASVGSGRSVSFTLLSERSFFYRFPSLQDSIEALTPHDRRSKSSK